MPIFMQNKTFIRLRKSNYVTNMQVDEQISVP